MELVIMAAGMGSRYGGLKQIESINNNNEFIIDYSIYDALMYDFDKVIFIIKEENYEIFRNTVGKRIENKVKVEYVFQNYDNVPSKYDLNDRIKPLGTAHAILSAKGKVNSNFAVINADDFYGRDAFRKASEFLKNNKDESMYANVVYKAINTISENGSVKRGVCKSNGKYLSNLVESKIDKKDNKLFMCPLDSNEEFFIEDNTLVSMNLLLFTPKLFDYLDEMFIEFLEENKDNLSSKEFLIPDVITKLIKDNKIKCELIETDSKWMGVTYKEDKEYVVNAIKKLEEDKTYPKKLWN